MPFVVPASSLSAGESSGGRMKHKKKHRTAVHHHHKHHHAHMTGQLMRGHGMSLGEASHHVAMMRAHHKVSASGLHAAGHSGRGMHAAGAGRGMKKHHHKGHKGGHHRKCGHCKGTGMRRSGTGPCGHCKGTGFWSDFGEGFKKGFFGAASIGAPIIGAVTGHPGVGAAIGNVANGLSGL